MIQVTRMNDSTVIINALLIESIESTPDSVITLVTGKKYIVKEPADDIVALVKQYLIDTQSQRAIVIREE